MVVTKTLPGMQPEVGYCCRGTIDKRVGKRPNFKGVYLKLWYTESMNETYPYGLMMIRCVKISISRQLNSYIISIVSGNSMSPSPLSL